MAALHPDLRRQFEKKIVEARNVATAGATAALKRMGVADREAPGHLITAEQKALRVKLRAKARQIGDPFDSKQRIFSSLTKITHEVAYEHWHRMLFARFLAENHLLIHPDMKVAVTLAECKELAEEEAAKTGTKPDAWLVASRFASRMLPQIFRQDDPVLALGLAPEHQLKLERLLEEVPADVFTADDSLGWVYQFWQKEEKDRVNRAGDKITSETLPAVTQLFTEHYMVLFLLHNTIGAWHAGKVLAANPRLAKEAKDEEELRHAVALDGYTFNYLRFIRTEDGKGPWAPAAGTFAGWPKTAAELKMLDPCCGSGHFLIAGFDLLVWLRMVEESLSRADAVDAVLRNNLHGLEIDPRCTQIAAFNVALAAWKTLGGHRELPSLQIACAGLAPAGKKDEWLALADAEPPRDREPVRFGLGMLYDAFVHAPTLGSLINPSGVTGTLGAADYDTLRPALERGLASQDEDVHAEAVAAQGLLAAAELLSRSYTLVLTNVPYLGRGKQDPTLQAWADEHEPDAKADLATMFISRALGHPATRRVNWLDKAGTLAVVCPQNWLFLTTYKKLRERLLRDETWNVVARLGNGAFETIGGAVVNVALLSISRGEASDDHAMRGLDASIAKTPTGKAALLRGETGADPVAECAANLRRLPQAGQRKNPNYQITIGPNEESALLSAFADTWQGLVTGDVNKFTRCFWEVGLDRAWQFFVCCPDRTAPDIGRSTIVRWDGGEGTLHRDSSAHNFPPRSVLGCEGVLLSQVGEIYSTTYRGEIFDLAVPLIPQNAEHLPAIRAFCEDESFNELVRSQSQSLAVRVGYFLNVPFDLSHWQAVAAEKYPNGLPEPESDDPTQWLFHGRPEASAAPLQVAVARLAGYRWPAERDEKMRLSPRARELIARCGELQSFADKDGVVAIPVVGQESPAAERLRALLAAAYGKEWSPAKLHQLLSDPKVDWADAGLEDWLRNGFFEQHCALFHQRPFVWQIWDGRKDGFSVLVNSHKLADGKNGAKLLEKIIYRHLGDWITRQEEGARKSPPVPGADLRLGAAKELQAKLAKIAEGEAPFDIFVRWKPIEQQPIGWEPDLNDGVRMNIRPFVQAGVLRKNPKINWNKDRGKDPESAPWFKKFKGERINDYHLTLEEKRAARERAESAHVRR